MALFDRIIEAKERRDIAKERRSAELGIEEFFREDDRPTSNGFKWAIAVIFLAIASTAAFLLVSFSLPSAPSDEFELLGLDYNKSNRALLIVGFVATALWSLAAAFFAVELVNRSNLSRIRLVRDLTRDGALREIFKVLKGYNGRYSENKNIEIVFEKIETSPSGAQVMSVMLNVKQRMPIDQKELVFDFITLDRSDKISDRVELSLQSGEVPHDAIAQDITDIKANFPDREKEMFKGLTEVIIDSDHQDLDPKLLNGIPTHRRWKIDTRKYIGGGMIDLSYRYRYSVEVPGFSFFSVTEPTKGFSCSLKYSSIEDKISVYYINMINNRIFQHDAGDFSEKRYISQSDWVIPNSNVTFCWYPKNKNEQIQVNEKNEAANMPGPNPVHETAPDNQLLDVDGNCLGIALLDIHSLMGVKAPLLDYTVLADPSDAAEVLLKNFSVLAIEKNSNVSGLNWLFKWSARRLGISTIQRSNIVEEDVILCQRSMLQLYGIDRPELHWVVIHSKDGELNLKDRLSGKIRAEYPDAILASAQDVLDQEATSMIVRKSI